MGSYDPVYKSLVSGPKIGKQSRENILVDPQVVKVPGPDVYDTRCKITAVMKRATNGRFGSDKRRATSFVDPLNPGPGAYAHQSVMESSRQAKTISLKYKPAKVTSSETPGPGSYSSLDGVIKGGKMATAVRGKTKE